MAGDAVTLLRLNLGCGGQLAAGWVNVDRARPANPADECLVIHDLRQGPLPWADGTAEAIVLHHVLDLLTEQGGRALLVECRRVLKRSGMIRISLADFDLAIDAALADKIDWFAEPRIVPPDYELELDLEATLGWFITQGGARLAHYTPAGLCTLLEDCGFVNAYATAAHITCGPAWLTELDARVQESFFVEAIR